MSGVLSQKKRPGLRHPAQVVTVLFAGATALSTALLLLPIAKLGPGGAGFFEAFFMATSAISTTGLATVDMANHWTTFGEVVILITMQIGGLGIMTLGSFLALLVARRLGLRARLNTAGESNTIRIGDVRQLLWGIVRYSLIIEAVIASLLALRFATTYDETPLRAMYLGIFHSVAAFTNSGLALYSTSLMSFASDWAILMPINVAVILGGIGFPVLLELRRHLSPKHWSLHVKVTIVGSIVLFVVGFVVLTAAEWTNPATLGAMDYPARFLSGITMSVQPRSGGLNSVDYSQMGEASLFMTNILMFIGGGSASTAGGIKVSTFFLLFFVIIAEVRGSRDVQMGDRRIVERTQRQALSVGLLAAGLVAVATLLVMMLEPIRLNVALFEVTSAFATCGLSTGITSSLGEPAQLILIILMFLGRVGPVAFVSALALRERPHLYRLPEGRPLIG